MAQRTNVSALPNPSEAVPWKRRKIFPLPHILEETFGRVTIIMMNSSDSLLNTDDEGVDGVRCQPPARGGF